jgi:uncharacterized protein YjbI with pentapeptide repeats
LRFLWDANLTSVVHLREADLTDASLSGAWLLEADLSYADLSGVDLSSANLTRANLIGAKGRRLRVVLLEGAELPFDQRLVCVEV